MHFKFLGFPDGGTETAYPGIGRWLKDEIKDVHDDLVEELKRAPHLFERVSKKEAKQADPVVAATPAPQVQTPEPIVAPVATPAQES